MGFDARLKRYFPVILCALIGLAAYFQASAVGRMVGSALAAASGEAPATAPPSLPPLRDEAPSAGSILARNPFDSITGPLDGSQLPESPASDGGEQAQEIELASDGDPSCTFGRVVLISASPDPTWSFAAIKDGSGQSLLRRVGDEVSGHTVQAMGWDTVWLESSGKRCQLKLGDEAKAPPKPKKKKASRRRGRGRKLAPELAAKISKVSETEYNIDRSMLDELLQNQASLMRSARIAPVKRGGKVLGVKLSGIGPGTLLDHLGMKSGDVLQTINGFDMSDPQKALEAYGRLQSARSLKVQILRGGKPTTLDFNIQ